MKNRHIITPILFFLILASFASANILVSPTTINEQVKVNEGKPFSLNVTSKFNFTIYNVSVADNPYFKTTPSGPLSINESTVLSLLMNGTEAGVKNGSLTVQFLFNISQTLPSETRKVRVNASGYNETNIDFAQDSTLELYNNDTIAHTFQSTAPFNIELQPGQTYSYQFSAIGNFNVVDTSAGNIQLYVNVKNKTVAAPAHSSAYDVLIPYALSFTLVETTLEFSILDPSSNITLNISQKRDVVLRVKNTGSKDALNVTLLKDSQLPVVFSKNVFTLVPGEQSIVLATVNLESLPGELSNKTHSIKFSARALNAEELSSTLGIFVPASDGLTTSCSADTAEFFKAKKVFCDAYPQSPYCLSQPLIVEKNVTVFVPQQLSVNYTQEDLDRINRAVLESPQTIETSMNVIKQRLDEIAQYTGAAAATAKNASAIVERVEGKQEGQGTILGWFIGLLIFAGSLFSAWKWGKPFIEKLMRHKMNNS